MVICALLSRTLYPDKPQTTTVQVRIGSFHILDSYATEKFQPSIPSHSSLIINSQRLKVDIIPCFFYNDMLVHMNHIRIRVFMLICYT